VRPLSYIIALTLAVSGCFAPAFQDGEVECGTAGCPPGMACGPDGYCHVDPWADGSGDELVLAVGHDQGVRIYAYCEGELREVWSLSTGPVHQVAWGDIDGDDIPELAVANLDGAALLLTRTPDGFADRWRSASLTPSRAVALADFDGDGLDDLVVGHDGGPLSLYRAASGGLSLTWSSTPASAHREIAIGDFDQDGDPDLAVAVKHGPDKVYRNDGGALSLFWTTSGTEDTATVAWGDVDGDGRVELAIGGDETPVRMYGFDGTAFASVWESPMDRDDPTALAFGDYDGDGDIDLATGNSDDPDRIYRNDGGVLTLVWSSQESNNSGGGQGNRAHTRTVSWVDVDRDGDLDLFVGRNGDEDELLRNDDGDFVEVWRAHGDLFTHTASWLPWQVPSGYAPLCSL
jgi:hypothetical protein